MELTTAKGLLEQAELTKKSIADLVAEYEAFLTNTTVEHIRLKMGEILGTMRFSIEEGKKDAGKFAHLAKGYGLKTNEARLQGNLIGGPIIEKIIVYSLAVAQSNASLGRIVACPTAGSCGVLPGALLPIAEELQASDEEIIDSLLVAAGIGTISASQGPISGAEGGCQAETGVASAMAAGAIAYLAKGSNHDIFNAASLALQNLLGLVCDPVAGLVEIPCITRNAGAAVNSLVAVNLTIAGVPCHIPFDETVQAMKSIGRLMDFSLRETSQGGLATTPTGKRLYQELREKHRLED